MKAIKDSWLWWFFVTSRKCNHEPGVWMAREVGMGKIRYCKKCGKVMDLM